MIVTRYSLAVLAQGVADFVGLGWRSYEATKLLLVWFCVNLELLSTVINRFMVLALLVCLT